MSTATAFLRPRRAFHSGLTVVVAVLVAAVFLPAGRAVAGPTPADLAVSAASDPSEIGPAGGPVNLVISVRNVGGLDAADTAVKLELPAGATISFGDSTGGWRCDAAALKCRYGTVSAVTEVGTLVVTLTLPAGSDGQTATVGVTVSTTSRESSTTNNTARCEIRYVAVADLVLEMTPEISEISTFGGNGARASVNLRVTNTGTRDAADVRLTIVPPAVGWLEADNFVTDGWSCSVSAAPWVCTGGPVAIGAIAYLNVPLRFPAGNAGETLTMTGAVATASSERSLGNNTDEVSIRYATPAPADLSMLGVAVNPYQVKAGDTVDVSVYVENVGASPAENVSVRVPLPATVQALSADPGNPDWGCTLTGDTGTGERVWECVRALFDLGELTNVLHLQATVAAGTPDGTLAFTATATTTSPEQSLDNNTTQGTTTYVAEGIVSGRVWFDLDRDGQRDPDEPHAQYEVGKIEFILEGTQSTWDTPVAYVNNYDGTYFQRLKPGRYVVRVLLHASANVDFTVADVGDDATDSDILTSVATYYGPVGESAVIEVLDGGTVVVDVGMVPTA